MLILAVSTSGSVPSAALLRDGEIIGMECDKNGLTHSETIMPLIIALLEKHGVLIGDVDAFAADAGPGSFTGVRIGVAAVNALSFALSKPLVSVDSLRALALPFDECESVCALIDARNGNAYAASYSYGKTVMPPSGAVVSELLEKLPDGTVFVGDGAEAYRELIESRVKAASVQRGEYNTLYADALGKIAAVKLQCGDTVKEAVPMYLRPTQAERMYKEKRDNGNER